MAAGNMLVADAAVPSAAVPSAAEEPHTLEALSAAEKPDTLAVRSVGAVEDSGAAYRRESLAAAPNTEALTWDNSATPVPAGLAGGQALV